MVDAHSRGQDPQQDAVIPPPPAQPYTSGTASVPPLAPPLGGPPAGPTPPPAPQRPAAPLPPYAAGVPTGPGHAEPNGYPAASYPAGPPATGGNRIGIALALVGGLVGLIVIGFAIVVGVLVNSPDDPSAAPGPTSVAEDPSAPPADDSSADDSADSEPADTTGIEAQLEDKIDEYKRLRDSGALWESIPDTEFNRTAVSAFLYFLTDMKVATIWGVDEAQVQEYQDRMTMLEERLLAQQPLGDDITITLETEVFTYDGETGEGGYTPK